MSREPFPFDNPNRFNDPNRFDSPNPFVDEAPKRKTSSVLKRFALFLIVSFAAIVIYIQVPWFHQRSLPEIVGELLETEPNRDKRGQFHFGDYIQETPTPEIEKNWALELMVEAGIPLSTAENRRYSKYLSVNGLSIHHGLVGFPVPREIRWGTPDLEVVKQKLTKSEDRLSRILAIVDQKTEFHLPIDTELADTVYFFDIHGLSYHIALRHLEGALYSRIQAKMENGAWESAMQDIVKFRKLAHSLQKNGAIGTCSIGSEFARSAFECEKKWFASNPKLEPKQLAQFAKELNATLPSQGLFDACQRLSHVDLLDSVQRNLTFDVEDPQFGPNNDRNPVSYMWVNHEIVFRIADEWYQRFWAAWKIEAPADRIKEMRQVIDDLRIKRKEIRAWQSSYAWLSVDSRSELFVYHSLCRKTDANSSMGVDQFKQMITAEERTVDARSRAELSILGFLVLAHRQETSSAPKSWEAIKNRFVGQIGTEAEFRSLIADPVTGEDYQLRGTENGIELSGESADSKELERITLFLPWKS